ncbi:MAG: hypothetical protein OEY94_05115 [Alphaproteobacteria bacterium]|nr:hypothetical protein [Alphaproteobacteria bacterium]
MSGFSFQELEDFRGERKTALLVNNEGKVAICYDQKPEFDISWVEFDSKAKKISLVSEEGQYQNLGVSISDDMKLNLLKAQEILLAYVKNKEIISCALHPFVVSAN